MKVKGNDISLWTNHFDDTCHFWWISYWEQIRIGVNTLNKAHYIHISVPLLPVTNYVNLLKNQNKWHRTTAKKKREKKINVLIYCKEIWSEKENNRRKNINNKDGFKRKECKQFVKCKINHMDFISWKQGLAVAIITKY